MSKFGCTLAAFAVATLGSIGAANAEANILFILDASGSMYGRVDDTPKIDVAKSELKRLVAELPTDAHVGLMTYGATSKSDCTDIQLLSPVGSTADLGGTIEGINALGKTPIAAALQQSASAFAGFEGQNNNVVLISDGIESCDGDPCAASTALVSAGIGVRVNVIGFDLTEEDARALKCIADNGNGKYFPADDTKGFTEAINDVVKVADTDPAPIVPSENVVFDETFDGEGLDTNRWTVLNPDEETYTVEDGAFLTVEKANGGFHNPDQPNILKLNDPLPKGDYTVTTTFRMEFATGREQMQIGLYEDADNYISASLYSAASCCNSTISVQIAKMAGGELTSFNVPLVNVGGDFDQVKTYEQPITLKLIKEGRSYRAEASVEGLKEEGGNTIVKTTDPISSLKAPKSLAFDLTQYEDVSGETTAYLDEIKITQ